MRVKIEVSHSMGGFPLVAGQVYGEPILTPAAIKSIIASGRGLPVDDVPAAAPEPTPEPEPPPADESGAGADAQQALATLTEKLTPGAADVQTEIGGADALIGGPPEGRKRAKK